MVKAVVLLSCSEGCAQAGKIAKAILGGYQRQEAIEVYLYNYRTRVLHRFTPSQIRTDALTAAAMCELEPSGNPDIRLWWDMAKFLGCQPPAVPITSITGAQLASLAQLAVCKAGMTTLDVNKFDKRGSGEWVYHADAQLQSVCAKLPGRELCFIIAPNPRNAPVRLQTYGHKLDWDAQNNRVRYTRHSGTTFPLTHLVETQYDAVCSLCEIALCRAIIRSSSMRFLGNCYGAQIMWVSLGGGLTSFKRNLATPHRNTLVVVETRVRPPINVSWDSGVTVGDRDHGAPLIGRTSHDNAAQIDYNTDYHHSCMMILSAALDRLRTAGKDSFVRHELADLIVDQSLDSQVGDNQFLARLRAYARKKRWDLDLPSKKPSWEDKTNRTWEWMGEYHCCGGRVSGFQGHPLLHLDIVDTRQDTTKQYMRQQLFG